jgi:hypothetical protein
MLDAPPPSQAANDNAATTCTAKDAREGKCDRGFMTLLHATTVAVFEAHGGGKETRTPDPYAASVMLYQLSYAPRSGPALFIVVVARAFAGLLSRANSVSS